MRVVGWGKLLVGVDVWSGAGEGHEGVEVKSGEEGGEAGGEAVDHRVAT